MDQFHSSRREFFKIASSLGVTGAVGTALPFALNLATMGTAAAQTSGINDYKALVCLFLFGANDHGNTVIATDSASWSAYQTVRTTNEAGSIALPAVGQSGGVIAINPKNNQGRSFALHPAMKEIQSLFENGRAAIVANVGPLITPTILEQYRQKSVPLPPKLFSHNDQQSLWQSYAPEGAKFGWGGRMGDLLASNNTHRIFTAISAAGNAVFLSGREINQYQVSNSGATGISAISGSLYTSSTGAAAAKSIITSSSNHVFQKDYNDVVNRAINAQSLLSPAMASAGSTGVPNPTPYKNPNTGALANNALATQLQTVARIIAGRNSLGAKRQVFFVSMGGFDTHDNQKTAQADLLAKLSHGIAYFDEVMGNLMGTNMRNQVTLFTASDFGRTFTSNGDGTDHGWGSHHFVVGGAVKGKDIYGKFPIAGLKHNEDVGSGSLLPQFSVDQYGATLANWFGLNSSQIADVFPNITNFTTKNLGFI